VPVRNQNLSGLCYIAWDTTLNIGKLGDVQNHVLRLILDGVETQPSQQPQEVDPTNCPGLYKLSLAAFEMDAAVVVLHGTSSTNSVIIIPVQLTTSVVASLTAAQFNVGTQIWTNQQLALWSADALADIAVNVPCIFARECLPITQGKSVYTLPNYVRTLRRVTWRGKSLEPASWEELQLLTPATVFLDVGSSANIETSVSRPLFYAMHPTNPYDIRLHPCPNETFTINGEPDPYSPIPNSPSCIIDYWREPDTTGTNPLISLPPYISRRTQKAYVLSVAFAAEGKGQDGNASNYYDKKYQFLLDQFRAINEGCFISKKYSLGDGMLDPQNYRYPRPMLGPNFERTIF
jgi:hypothetical protein